MKEFFFERDDKQYTVTLVEGKMHVKVLDVSKDKMSAEERPATWLEIATAYQVMAYMFMQGHKL